MQQTPVSCIKRKFSTVILCDSSQNQLQGIGKIIFLTTEGMTWTVTIRSYFKAEKIRYAA
jgi:hypothetical protein